MTTASTATSGSSFRRATAAVASAGIVAGFSLVAASPAMAASDVDCTPTNTVDATAGAAAFQTLLDANAPVVCLTGTLSLTNPLLFSSTLTIYGLGSGAVLDGSSSGTNILHPSDGYDGGLLTLQSVRVTGSADGAVRGGPMSIIDSRFDNNDGYLGGAIESNDIVTVTNSVFESNSAVYGGAIAITGFGDNLTVTGSTFTDNYAEQDGGAIMSNGVASIAASTFVQNSAENYGGAVSAYGISSTNVTYFANSAYSGGALYVAEGEGTVLHSTFLDNTAENGQSIFVDGGGVLDVRGNIFAGSTELAHLGFEGSIPQTMGNGVVTLAAEANGLDDLGGNVFSTQQATETILPTPTSSVLFGKTPASIFGTNGPAGNGGPAQTIALIQGSPAINAVPEGSPAVTVDERGVARGAFSDAGAYEYDGPVGAALPNTGVLNSGWLMIFSALLAAAGAVAVGAVRLGARRR